MRTVFTPARCAASSFDFSPPMGRTRPRSVISPVMARSRRTGLPVSRLAIAVAMVTPALGPSFGVAPAGTWRLLHHVAQLAGQQEVVLAVHARRLDLHDVATGVADDEPGDHADLIL